MERMNSTNAMMNTIRSFVLMLLRDMPSRGVMPTIFHPVYPTVFTDTIRFSPSNTSS